MSPYIAVTYARFSSDNQREESIEAQLFDNYTWATSNNYKIVKEYIDKEETATTDDNRDDFLQMISDIQNDYIKDLKAVIVHKSNRFARNKWDAAIYKKALDTCGVKVVYAMQPMLNEDTPEAFLLEGIFESLDQYYSMDLSREVMKGMKTNARHCKHNGGVPPLGYDVDPETKTYVINEKEARAIQLIYTMYDKGHGYSQIIDRLNAEGYRTKRGKTFGKNSIFELLRNEKYIGVYTFNRAIPKVKGKRNNRKNKSSDQIIRIPGGVPQIIDKELWDRVQTKMKSRAHNPGERARNKAKVPYLLSGKLYCGECESKMVGKNGGKFGNTIKKDYYICNNRERRRGCKAKMIQRDRIDQLVLAELEKKILNPDMFSALADEIHKNLSSNNDAEKEMVYLRAELAKVQAKINNTLDLVEAGAGSAELVARLQQRENEKALLINRLQEVERQLNANKYTKEMIVEFLENEYQNLKLSDNLTNKQLIDKYVEKVTIKGDTFEATFKILHTDGYPTIK